MIMRNKNRLIDDFKYHTGSSIWKFLNTLAANYAVYSTHLNGLLPFMTAYDVYLYCCDTNVVILCLDCCGNSEEHTYEESKTLSPLILKDGEEPRVSVVWKLAEAVRHAKDCLRVKTPDINVFGVLLTEANIFNAADLYEMWHTHQVDVIDDLKRLKYREIRVNPDSDLACKTYVDVLIDNSSHLATTEKSILQNSLFTENDKPELPDAEYEEFEKMLNDFINQEYDESSDMDSNEEQEEEDDLDLEDFPDESFPDGAIEQNNNISVKVEIIRPIVNPREELDKLVGCADIKRRMDELVALTSYNQMIRDLFPGSKQHEVSLHSVFLGRPGTGKTTVCKIFGSLLRQAGALSKGHVVVCDRGTFIGTLWGDEERSMRQVLEMAKGGVLMIDEAYLLNGKNDHDPGKMIIQLMMNILADETQRDIAVVLCGYKEPMMKLMDSNPGLLSRFPNKFEFTDFTVDELLEITRRRVKEYNYRFTAKAWEKYSTLLANAHQMRNPETWGNARFIANQLERIYIQHATRCIKHHPKSKQGLLMLTTEDILPIEIPRQRTKIGF